MTPHASMRNRTHRSLPGTLAVFAALVPGPAGPTEAAAQELPADPFVQKVVGEWHGQGEYGGNTLELRRVWSLELQDAFLRADMRVSMPNGFSFGALMYWRPVGKDLYDVVWMDGQGRSQTLRATRDPTTGVVSATYLDALAEGGPEWRTWEFEPRGPDAYVERLYRLTSAGRTLVTTFSFEREAGG